MGKKQKDVLLAKNEVLQRKVDEITSMVSGQSKVLMEHALNTQKALDQLDKDALRIKEAIRRLPKGGGGSGGTITSVQADVWT